MSCILSFLSWKLKRYQIHHDSHIFLAQREQPADFKSCLRTRYDIFNMVWTVHSSFFIIQGCWILSDIFLLIMQTSCTSHVCCALYSYRANRPKEEQQDGEVDERFWELLLSADKKDYERICAEYGVTDFRWMLKKLNEKKREIEEQQAQVKCQASHLKVFPLYLPWE